MRIIFDLRSVGLGNNGGSQTLIRSANTLQDLKHKVCIIDSQKNKHTWNELKVPHIIYKKDEDIPDADIIIATGYKSVKHTLITPNRCGKKVIWVRGWETWQYAENDILNKVLLTPTIKIVNSLCLQDKLNQYNIKSDIIRPGYDFDEITPLNIRNKNDIFIIGGLYTNPGKHYTSKRTEWIFKTAKYFKEKYNNIQLWMMGNGDINNNYLVDKYCKRPNKEEKNEFYNNINVWLSTSQNEGLHMPPAEFMLTEGPVVGTRAKMSGTQDYLIDGITGVVTDDDFDSFVKGVEELYNNNSLRKELGIFARGRIYNLGDRKTNMKKLVNLLMEKKDVL